MRHLAPLFLLATLSLSAAPACAATLLTPKDLPLSAPIKDDVYGGGATIAVTQDVDGDLVVGGGTVSVQKHVTHDMLAAGGAVIITGSVDDDVRAAGGRVIVRGRIGSDLIVAGGNVLIDAPASVAGDVIAYGGSVTILGSVHGVRAAGGQLRIATPVRGDLTVNAGDFILNGVVLGKATIAADSIQLGKEAQFAGPVRYWRAAGPMDFGDSVKSGQNPVFDSALQNTVGTMRRNAVGSSACCSAFSRSSRSSPPHS
ncbi:hypothetical protein HYR82_00720 [Candidatus Peregrinibacteria bacterium]|nr:hypothetical protein [Candidatus Peregrinibacteria bacterium]